MEIWTKDNIINYTSDPEEANDKKFSKELLPALRSTILVFVWNFKEISF